MLNAIPKGRYGAKKQEREVRSCVEGNTKERKHGDSERLNTGEESCASGGRGGRECATGREGAPRDPGREGVVTG